MKKFEDVLYAEELVSSSPSYTLSFRPYLYAFLGLLFSFVPILDVLGLWFSVKSVDEFNWQGRRNFAGWIAIVFNIVSLLIVAFIVFYILMVYPSFQDHCEGLKAGSYSFNGEKIVCY